MLRHPASTRAASGYVTGQGHADHVRYGGLGILAPFLSTFPRYQPEVAQASCPKLRSGPITGRFCEALEQSYLTQTPANRPGQEA